MNGDVEIKNVDTQEHITNIFTKLIDSEFFGYIPYTLSGWQVNGILPCEGVLDYAHEMGLLSLYPKMVNAEP